MAIRASFEGSWGPMTVLYATYKENLYKLTAYHQVKHQETVNLILDSLRFQN